MTPLKNDKKRIIVKHRMPEDEIIALAQPATIDEICNCLELLFAGLKPGSDDEDGQKAKIKAYSLVVDDFPIFAIRDATTAFIKGEVEGASTRYIPSAAEYRNEIRRKFFQQVQFDQPPAHSLMLPKDHFRNRYENGEYTVPEKIGGIDIKEIVRQKRLKDSKMKNY